MFIKETKTVRSIESSNSIINLGIFYLESIILQRYALCRSYN